MHSAMTSASPLTIYPHTNARTACSRATAAPWQLQPSRKVDPVCARRISTTRGSSNAHHRGKQQGRQVSAGAGPVLVDGLVVQPAYRSTPWEAEAKRAAAAKDKAVVMFVSESGICRGPLAAAAFKQLLQDSPLRDCVQVQLRATRDYCVGQSPHPATAAAAATLGFSLAIFDEPSAAAAAAGATSGSNSATTSGSSDSSSDAGSLPSSGPAAGVCVFSPSEDIVAADMVLVMDKYTAADVLREVSSYDLINPGGHYSSRVRLLGSFHPQLASHTQTPDGQDIDDALYGNEGGEEEQATVLTAAKVVVESCRNLLQHLEELAATHGLLQNPDTDATATSSSGGSNSGSSSGSGSSAVDANEGGSRASSTGSSRGEVFRAVLVQHVQQEGVMEWLVPPMLQGSNVDVDGWV